VRRANRSQLLGTSIPSDFARHVNQRNNDSNRADNLANCTNGFPIHDMIHVIAAEIQSQRAGVLEGQSWAARRTTISLVLCQRRRAESFN
jgi:hypothetical protein